MQRKFTRHIQELENGDKWQRLKALKPSSIHHEKYTLVRQQKIMQIIYQNELPMSRERQFKFYPPFSTKPSAVERSEHNNSFAVGAQ